MSLWAVLEPLSATVDAGGSAAIALRIRNTGDIVEEYHVDMVGDPAFWCAIEPTSVRLYPGSTATVRLTFFPPRTSDAAAGPHPFGVRVTPVENPEAVLVPEGNLTVTPFVDVRAELLPATVRGWRRAKPRLVVDNYGNTTATAAVAATASGNRIDFDIRTPSVQVSPGRANFSVLRLRPERLLWLGQKVGHPFTTTLQLSGSAPVSTSGTYQQSALLPSWMARVFAGLAALLAAFVGLWFAINPSVSSTATQQAAAAATSAPTTVALPPPQAPPSSPPAPQSAKPPPAAPPAGGSNSSPGKPHKAPLPAPAHWWQLNGGDGKIAADTGGNSPATLSSSAAWCPGNTCARFNGTDSYAATASSVLNTSPGQSFTVTAQVILFSTDPRIQTMVSQDGAEDSGFYLQYLGSAGSDCWAFSRVGARAASNVRAQANTWTYLAGVFDASDNKLSIYVNGVLEGTKTLPAPAASNGPLVMGRAKTGGKPADWFGGQLRNVRVYKTALTADQLDAIEIYK